MPARAGCIYRAAGVVSIGGTAGLLRQGLRTDEAGIEPVLRQKLGMGALLDGFPVGHGDDEVGVAHGREPMGDDDGGAATAEAGERHVAMLFEDQRANLRPTARAHPARSPSLSESSGQATGRRPWPQALVKQVSLPGRALVRLSKRSCPWLHALLKLRYTLVCTS